MRRTLRWSLMGVAALMLLLTPAAATADPDWYDSPIFGLDTAPNGSLLVADAGQGIVQVRGQRRRTIALPGVTDVSPVGSGLLWATTGAGPGQTDPQNDTGQALHRIAGGNASEVVNLFAFEERANPDGNDPPDSNPFDVEALSGNAALVVDAGGNDLLRVNKRGAVDVLATFPNQLVSTENIKDLAGCPGGPPDFCGLPAMLPAQAVPTSVAIGPDGAYYVGELKGFPAPTGASRIWRVAADASSVECGSTSPACELVFDGGFTSIIDLRFGPDGALYVVEFDEASWAAVEIFQMPTGGTVNRCDIDSLDCSEVVGGLPVVTAVTFDKDGDLWAAVDALSPDLADVVEIDTN